MCFLRNPSCEGKQTKIFICYRLKVKLFKMCTFFSWKTWLAFVGNTEEIIFDKFRLEIIWHPGERQKKYLTTFYCLLRGYYRLLIFLGFALEFSYLPNNFYIKKIIIFFSGNLCFGGKDNLSLKGRKTFLALVIKFNLITAFILEIYCSAAKKTWGLEQEMRILLDIFSL